jgi:hypothetical protein
MRSITPVQTGRQEEQFSLPGYFGIWAANNPVVTMNQRSKLIGQMAGTFRTLPNIRLEAI